MYYDCIDKSICGDYLGIELFKKDYPSEYKRLSAIHTRRSKINKSVKAMLELNENNVYWGTLTFNNEKNVNKETTKRKSVFSWLNTLFDYFLIVEEYGEKNNRYHVHFVGQFKFDKSVDDFVNKWHSREQIRKLDCNKNIASYLCKYLSKDLPRIRRNKGLVKLTNAYKKGAVYDNLGFKTLGKKYQVQGVNLISIFDLED